MDRGHRVHNWPAALDEEVERAKAEEWNVYSRCILFAARCVQAVTGIDYTERFPPFATQEQAEGIIAEHGSLEALIESVLGEALPTPAFAHRGDVVLVDTPDAIGEAAGICLGSECAFTSGRGLIFVPRFAVKTAWRV